MDENVPRSGRGFHQRTSDPPVPFDSGPAQLCRRAMSGRRFPHPRSAARNDFPASWKTGRRPSFPGTYPIDDPPTRRVCGIVGNRHDMRCQRQKPGTRDGGRASGSRAERADQKGNPGRRQRSDIAPSTPFGCRDPGHNDDWRRSAELTRHMEQVTCTSCRRCYHFLLPIGIFLRSFSARAAWVECGKPATRCCSGTSPSRKSFRRPG